MPSVRGFRSHPLSHKTTPLPAGVSATWRHREGRSPYLEFQASWYEGGKIRVKHFYVGVDPTPAKFRAMRARAIAFRLSMVAQIAAALQAVPGPGGA